MPENFQKWFKKEFFCQNLSLEIRRWSKNIPGIRWVKSKNVLPNVKMTEMQLKITQDIEAGIARNLLYHNAYAFFSLEVELKCLTCFSLKAGLFYWQQKAKQSMMQVPHHVSLLICFRFFAQLLLRKDSCLLF